MDGINIPTSVDWFNSTITAIIIAVIASSVNSLNKNEISSKRAFSFISTVLIIAIGAILFWYNLIGVIYFNIAYNKYLKNGCGTSVFLWQETINWNPQITDARQYLIECNTELKRPQDSLAFLEKMESQLSSKPQYWKQMSLVYFEVGDYQKMQNSLVRYADMSPIESSDWIVSICVKLMTLKKIPEAESAIRIARTHNGANNLAVFWLAWALYEKQDYADALYHFDLCIQRYTPSGASYELGRCFAGKGFVYLDTGYQKEARKEFDFALFFYKNQVDVEKALSELP